MEEASHLYFHKYSYTHAYTPHTHTPWALLKIIPFHSKSWVSSAEVAPSCYLAHLSVSNVEAVKEMFVWVSVGVWECGSVGVWECRRQGLWGQGTGTPWSWEASAGRGRSRDLRILSRNPCLGMQLQSLPGRSSDLETISPSLVSSLWARWPWEITSCSHSWCMCVCVKRLSGSLSDLSLLAFFLYF